jgi:hypothetical protein
MIKFTLWSVFVLEHCDQDHTVLAALLECLGLNVDKLGRTSHQQRGRSVFRSAFDLCREGPFGRTNGFVIRLPDGVHDLKINEVSSVEDGDTLIGMFW